MSSNEDEWIVLLESIDSIIFVINFLKSMGIKLIFQIMIRIYNIRAIYIITNPPTTNSRRHLSARGASSSESTNTRFARLW